MKMKACTMRRYGRNQVPEVGDQPQPVAGPGELLVRVHAAGVNPVDFKTVDGALRVILSKDVPKVLGNEFSGVVESVGAGVSRFRPGDAVFARVETQRMGAFAEYAVVHESLAAFKPAGLSHAQAAAVPLAALTAWQALFDKAGLKAGQKVLIHAGSGGVGSFAIQFAKDAGAVVATTVGTRNLELARSLGADTVIDYTRQRFEDAVRDCDVVTDTQGGEVQQRSFAVLKPGGVLVSMVGMPDSAFARRFKLGPVTAWLFDFLNRKPRKWARQTGTRFEYLFMEGHGEQLAQIARLLEDGQVRPVIERTFPLEQAAQALALVRAGHVSGKVVLQVRDEA